ncbi:hypothetical protein [Streptomyces sp. NPDC056632]|uniref:hypothetical protein n=1 Tax=Streptomyces sp. NPDC056632 TaxID=3345884 RepID=UPI0036A8E0AD
MIWATLGGVTVGLAVLIKHLIDWYPGMKALRKDPARHAAGLAPFLIAWCYGALGILTVGGLIGWAFDAALWATNWLGDVALVWGVNGPIGTVSRGATYLPLTGTGNCVVLLLTVGIFAAIKKKEDWRVSLKRGIWCGLGLGTSAGVAGLAAVPLAQAANWLGATLYGAIG